MCGTASAFGDFVIGTFGPYTPPYADNTAAGRTRSGPKAAFVATMITPSPTCSTCALQGQTSPITQDYLRRNGRSFRLLDRFVSVDPISSN